MKIDQNFVSYLCQRFTDKSQTYISKNECICTVLDAVEKYETKVSLEIKNEISLKEQQATVKRIQKQTRLL